MWDSFLERPDKLSFFSFFSIRDKFSPNLLNAGSTDFSFFEINELMGNAADIRFLGGLVINKVVVITTVEIPTPVQAMS